MGKGGIAEGRHVQLQTACIHLAHVRGVIITQRRQQLGKRIWIYNILNVLVCVYVFNHYGKSRGMALVTIQAPGAYCSQQILPVSKILMASLEAGNSKDHRMNQVIIFWGLRFRVPFSITEFIPHDLCYSRLSLECRSQSGSRIQLSSIA